MNPTYLQSLVIITAHMSDLWLHFVKDESVRLWNVHTGICILIFAGAGGHRNEVLSVVSMQKTKIFFGFP